jgi:HEAT repeat protein
MMDVEAAKEALRTGEESVRRQTVLALARSGRKEAVAALLIAVSDDSWPVREAAVERLAVFDRELLLPGLEAALRDEGDASARNAAMEIYVRLGPGAVEPVVRLLGDEDADVRGFAAAILGTLREPQAVAPLIAALGDADVNVRHAAASALGRIGAKEAVPPLIEALSTEPWLQYPAISALGEIGDPRATPALVSLLDDELLRGPALEALARFAGRGALPHVIPHLSAADPTLRNLAIRAVVEIEQRATAGGESLDPELQAALRQGDLVDHLLRTLEDDELQNRRTAIVILGWLREPRAEARLVELLAEPALHEHVAHALVSIGCHDKGAYAAGLAHPDDAVRQGTLRCLAWTSPPGAIDLAAPLVHDPSPEVRAEAVAAVGRLGDEDAAMLLFELLGDEHERIQESARDALARMPKERVLPLLLQALSNPDPQVRVRSAETLGLLQEPGAAPALVALLRDAREGVRRAAIKALGETGAPGVAEVLRSALGDESSVVRQQAVVSLGRRAELETAALLLPVLEDPDPRMRFVAIRSLGQIRNPEAVDRLLPFLDDERKELRFAAVEALGGIRAASAVPSLVAVLRDPDRGLRRAAAESLGAVASPQAVPPLLWALEDEHWSVRSAAAAALGRIGSDKATTALLTRLDDDDPTVRRAAAVALGEIGDPRGAARLTAALREPELETTALEALRRMGRAALPELERAFAGASAAVRRQLVDLLARLEDPRVERLLLAALADPSAEVRADAAFALGDARVFDALRPLMALKAQDPSPEVRRAASAALRRLAPR